MTEPEVLFEVTGHAGVMTLNRPRALNALTLGMVKDMHAKLERWAADDAVRHVIIRANGDKAFCAGGDIRALYDWGRAKDPTFLQFYREEYRLDALIKRFPKPYVALIDGIAMGGGIGVSVHGSHRVGSERLVFAMPETGIGFFPDVGGSYFLPRLPGETGLYFGLTGARCGVADAQYAGITTHHVAQSRFAELAEALCQEEDVDACLEAFAGDDPGSAPLAEQRQAIDRHFGHASVEAILASLEGDDSEWAGKTAATLRTKSPSALKITFRQLREGAKLEFEDCMRLEYRMVHGYFANGHDFFEGTRAVVVDKDQAPRWRPASLEAVSEADVAAYFQPVEDELPL